MTQPPHRKNRRKVTEVGIFPEIRNRSQTVPHKPFGILPDLPSNPSGFLPERPQRRSAKQPFFPQFIEETEGR
jgi:hypothetical protein